MVLNLKFGCLCPDFGIGFGALGRLELAQSSQSVDVRCGSIYFARCEILIEDALRTIKADEPRDDFDDAAQRLVSRLHKDVVQESCVVFVGDSSTTERSCRARDRGFYATIKAQTSHSGSNLSPSFPKLME